MPALETSRVARRSGAEVKVSPRWNTASLLKSDASATSATKKRVPEAQKGGEYKSPQTNVNDVDEAQIQLDQKRL
jgi:hypothetical protein